MQEEDALEGFVDNIDDPYNRFFEEPDDQHEQQLNDDYEEEDAPNGWRYVSHTEVPYKVHLNNVDDELLKSARIVVPRIVSNVKKAACVRQNTDPSDITIGRLSQIWFNHQLLRELLTRVNDALPGEQINIKELFQFLKVELFLNVYRCSPAMFYHPMARKLYPAAEMCMPHVHYQVILRALSQKQKVTDARCRSSGDDTWMRPMALDCEIVSLHAQVREACRKLLFIPDETILCIDDHHERKSSNTCKESGFAHIYNPEKALGPVMHTLSCVITGAFLGGVIQQVGQSVNSCTLTLLKSLVGRDIVDDSDIKLKNRIDVDRAYSRNGTYEMAGRVGMEMTSTQIRTKTNPITDGKAKFKPAPNQAVISPTGSMVTHWFRKVLGNPDLGSVYFMGSRNGMGTSWFMQTNALKYVNSFTIVPFPGSTSPKPLDIAETSEWITQEQMWKFITSRQRSRDWFMMRNFSQTSTGADNCLSALARNNLRFGKVSRFGALATEHEIPLCMQFSMNVLGFRHLHTHVVDGQDDDALSNIQKLDGLNNTAQMAFLQTKYVKELHHICKDLNIIGYANLRKAEIISLILNNVADPYYGGKPINIGETMIKAQHLTPFSKGHKQENMLMGTLNERNVVDHLKQFVELHCENACGLKLTVIDNKEYGLVGYKDEGIVPKAQITSIDQVFRVKDTTNLASTTFFVGCEIKTKTTRDTEQTEVEYIKNTLQNEVYGYISVCSEADAEVFKKQIPQRSHRVQVLHHAATLQVQQMFYVVASTQRILRVAHVVFSPVILANYCDSQRFIQSRYMNWIYGPDPVPTLADYGHAKSRDTIIQELAIWHELRKMIENRGVPLPPFKHFLPSVAATHNRYKVGVDSISAYIMRVKAVHEKLSTEGQLILTLITLMHYNTFISWRMIHGLNFLMDKSACSSYEVYKKHLNNSFGSFRMFCIQLVDVIESSLGIPEIMGVGVDHLISVVQEVEVEVNITHDSTKTHHAINANSEASRSARMSGWGKKGRHLLISVKQSKTCPLCCDRSPSAPAHSRFGYRPSWCCSECNEFLCKRKRWTKTGSLVEVGWKENSEREKAELSCYEVWHTFNVLPTIHIDCCTKEGVPHNANENIHPPLAKRRCVETLLTPSSTNAKEAMEDTFLQQPLSISDSFASQSSSPTVHSKPKRIRQPLSLVCALNRRTSNRIHQV